MKITAIKPYPVWVGSRNQMLVKVETDEGIYGWGESGVSGREIAVAGAVRHYREFLIGKAPIEEFGAASARRARLDRPHKEIVAELSFPGLELEPEALAPTRAHLAEVGNLSSSSVLFLLDEARRSRPEPGSHGVLLAMGPGFCAELVLLQW